ncbi:hypothetical protein [Inconstantimicrobium mannanitabidum]|uniref:Uncharacterized protein n=1 Tax=Inconstantimicrobium mannanitabidum TaxID=1604901 RepID=A0ACB5RIP9_9CLOT|nr:hypothetical protein [Clostridium sp. TW13]GKX68972.1 hypothetical protein rsdtw13_42300 [Clostridium sp. TW13]
MVIKAVLSNHALKIKATFKQDQRGNDIFTIQTFDNLNPAISDTDMLAVGEGIASLLEKNNGYYVLTEETYDLISE